MDTGEFPNFDTGIYIGCNFRRGEIPIRRKCEGKIFPEGISRLATFLEQDDLKEILVDAEAKGIKTHKERDKKQFKEILPYINHWHLGLEENLLRKLEKKTTRKRLSIHKNVLNAISQSELNILWCGRVGGKFFGQ